ncbi:MAG TPA: helix-turn-helix transcriptional regulator [Polyangiaceae bacterium]|nr:helix-turn-helix transcriptional regulator [Polyangiaceae bacterium]
MGKKHPPSADATSAERLRRLVKQLPAHRPAGLRFEGVEDGGRTLVLSYRIPSTDWQSLLTSTEAEIAHDVLAGLSNAEIAGRRGTAVRTIANQVASIYRKLRVRSRLELSLLALAGRHAAEARDAGKDDG